jgi:hypothetical protein
MPVYPGALTSPYHSLQVGPSAAPHAAGIELTAKAGKALPFPFKGIVIASFDHATLGNTLECTIPKIKEEMVQDTRALGTHLTPVGRPGAYIVTEDFVELSPLRSNFAESTLASIPAFVVRSTKPEFHAIYKSKKTDFVLLEFLELKWVHIEAEQRIIAQNLDVGIGSVRVGIPTEIKLQKMRLHAQTS